MVEVLKQLWIRAALPFGTVLLVLMIADPARSHPRVVFVGHSTTLGAGAGPSDLDNPEPVPGGFVDLLDRLWKNAEVVNAGCSGAGIPAFLVDTPSSRCSGGSAWSQLVEPELPAQVFHLFFNGGIGPPSWWSAPEKFEADLRALIDRIPGIVVISQHNRDSRYLTGLGYELFEAYRARVEIVVASDRRVFLGADLVDVLEFPEDFSDDQVHPNPLGHLKLAIAIAERFDALAQSPDFCRALLWETETGGLGIRWGWLPRWRRTTDGKACRGFL